LSFTLNSGLGKSPRERHSEETLL